MPSRIFLSYRRDDAAGEAGRLSDHLHQRFGAANVFVDVETIEPGTDFVEVLHTALERTAAMLVVIGPRWTSLQTADGTRRLDDPNDFVRLEVEKALGRGIPVVPVLVQGAHLPRKEDLPQSLAPLVTRQVAVLDHAEFHDDAKRLCDRLAQFINIEQPDTLNETEKAGTTTRWAYPWPLWPAAAVIAAVALGLAGYAVMVGTDERSAPGSNAEDLVAPGPLSAPVDAPRRTENTEPREVRPAQSTRRVEDLLSEASAQRRRNQFVEALATVARARDIAPDVDAVRWMQEDIAMEWIRNVRVAGGKSSFGDAIMPPLAIVDASLATATGTRRADLLAHSGWATFLMWRDGNRRLDPAEWYGEALSIDPGNPYANAMLAHWILLREDDVSRAAKLFDTALQAGRALDAVRTLQWAGYSNTDTLDADVERVRLADAMRRAGEKLNAQQAQSLWGVYAFVTARGEKNRQVLFGSLPPDDHISTLDWAFAEYAAGDQSRLRIVRYYVARLHESAGRAGQAIAELQALNRELADSPGSLSEAVQADLERLQPRSPRGGRGKR